MTTTPAPEAKAQPHLAKQPTLGIFLGSTPAEVGNLIEQELQPYRADRRLRYEALYLDTADLTGKLRHLRGRNYHQLKAPYEKLLELRRYHHLYLDLRIGDIFIEGHDPSSTQTGGGGIRNNGNAAVMTDLEIKRKLKNALEELTHQKDNRGRVEDGSLVTVHIVAFTGGATGSGTMHAVADQVREVAQLLPVNVMIFCWAMLPLPSANSVAKANSCGWAFELEAEHEYLLKAERERFSAKRGLTARLDTALNQDLNAFRRIGMAMLQGSTNEVGSFQNKHELAQATADNLLPLIINAAGVGAEIDRLIPDQTALRDRDRRNGLPTHLSTMINVRLKFPLDEYLQLFTHRAVAQTLKGLIEGPAPDEAAEDEEDFEAQDKLLNDDALTQTRRRLLQRAQGTAQRSILSELLGSNLKVNLENEDRLLTTLSEGLIRGESLLLTEEQVGERASDWTETKLREKEKEREIKLQEIGAEIDRKGSDFIGELDANLRSLIVDRLRNNHLDLLVKELKSALRATEKALEEKKAKTSPGATASDDEELAELRQAACKPPLLGFINKRLVREAREEYLEELNGANQNRLQDVGRALAQEVLTNLKRVLNEQITTLTTLRADLKAAIEERAKQAQELLDDLCDPRRQVPTHFYILDNAEAIERFHWEASPLARLSAHRAARRLMAVQYHDLKFLLGQATGTQLIERIQDYIGEELKNRAIERDYNAAWAFLTNYPAAQRQQFLQKAQEHARNCIYFSDLNVPNHTTYTIVGFCTENTRDRTRLEEEIRESLGYKENVSLETSYDPANIDICLVTFGLSLGALDDFAAGRFLQAYRERQNSPIPLHRSDNAKALVQTFDIEARVARDTEPPTPTPNAEDNAA